MKCKIYFLLVLLVTSFVFVSATSNETLKVSLSTPSATFNINYGDEIHYHIGVLNRNNFPIDIKISQPDNEVITFDGDTEFVLQPNESRIVNYLFEPNESKNLLIPILFKSQNQSFTLSSSLNIKVNGEQQTTQTNQTNSNSQESGNNQQNPNLVKRFKINTDINENEQTNETINESDTCPAEGCLGNSSGEGGIKLWEIILVGVTALIVIFVIILIIIRVKGGRKNDEETFFSSNDASSDGDAVSDGRSSTEG